jgi:hypothetical protein
MDDRRPLVGDDLCGLFSHEASPPESDSDGFPRSQSIEQSFAELKAHLRKAASDTPGMGQTNFWKSI